MTQKSFIIRKQPEKIIYPCCIRRSRTNGDYSFKVVIRENEKLFKRINYIKSTYQRIKQEVEYQKHLQRVKMISKVKSITQQKPLSLKNGLLKFLESRRSLRNLGTLL